MSKPTGIVIETRPDGACDVFIAHAKEFRLIPEHHPSINQALASIQRRAFSGVPVWIDGNPTRVEVA